MHTILAFACGNERKLWITSVMTGSNLFTIRTGHLLHANLHHRCTKFLSCHTLEPELTHKLSWNCIITAGQSAKMKTGLWADHLQTPELASHDAASLVISVLQWKGNNVRSKGVLYTDPILTYSVEQSPREANRFSASQEIPHILWNPKVHYRINKRQPPVPILHQFDPVHTPTCHFLKIHLNIILPFMPGFSKWSLSLRFPQQNPVCASPLHSYALHAPFMSFFSILSPEKYWVRSTDD